MQLKAVGGKPEEVDANPPLPVPCGTSRVALPSAGVIMLKAVDIAEKIAPYRHHKLAAIKLDKDPLPPGLRAANGKTRLRETSRT
jgi:hypothetical protein